MRLTSVSPLAASPASTSETEALRSVAITGAPVSSLTPRTSADPPCTVMRAPIRASSGTCMKRFSKMVSVIMAAPSATHMRAMNCACKSVAKPGNGRVITSLPRRPPSARPTCTPPSAASIRRPASSSVSLAAPKLSTAAFFSSTRPPVIAAAMA